MKRFITSILFVSVFFIGLGTLVEKAGARFKSDEKALELIRAARAAIGGDSAISSVRSLTVTGKTNQTFKLNGTDKTEQGESEIALQFPNKFSKMVKIGSGEGGENKQFVRNKEVVIVGDVPEGMKVPDLPEGPGVKHVIITKGDGTSTQELKGDGDVRVIVRNGEAEKMVLRKDGEVPAGDGNQIFIRRGGAPDEAMRHNEMLSTTLSLLLTAPEGIDISYTYAGEGNVDSTPCNIVEAHAAGATFKLYLSSESNLPVMISYISNELPRIMRFEKKTAPGDDQSQDKVIFNAKVDAPASGEVQVRFSDYRSVAGLQLPFRWSKSLDGKTAETLDVSTYEINPANIAEKLQQPKVFLRTTKEPQN